MKKTWYATYEGLETPLVIYFIGVILIGIGNAFTPTNETVELLVEALQSLGGLLKVLFPVFLVINVIGKRYDDSVPIIGGLVAYIVFNITTMFGAFDESLPSYFYDTFNSGTSFISTINDLLPLNFGIVSSFICISVTTVLYRRSRQRFNYGLLRFINNDAYFIVINILFTSIIAVILTLLYPYFASVTTTLLEFLSANSSNPACMFLYGIVERLLELLGMEEIIHETFWVGSLGGSWIDTATDITYIGDINVWTAQFTQRGVLSGVGKYTSAYYLINLIIVPAVMIGFYFQYSSRIERRRKLGLIVLGIIASITCGSLVPLEYLLLLISPALLFINVIISSTVYGVMSYLQIGLGYNFTGEVAFATPGTIFKFIEVYPYLGSYTLRCLIIMAVCYFIVCFYSVFFYYNHLALDFLDGKVKVRNRKEMIRALGGIDNIRLIDGSPLSFNVTLYDTDKIDKETILDLGASKVTESFFYVSVYYGPGSVSMANQIRKEIEEYRGCLKYIESK